MPVDTCHKAYNDNVDKWAKCRVCYDGEEAVKDAGGTYLPQLKDQDGEEYRAYKMRASFFNATLRTVQGLAGMAFRKPPEIKFTNKDLLKSVGLGGESLNTIVRNTLEEVLTVGRTGLYVDASQNGEEAAHPYVVQYYTENIRNWRSQVIDGREEPTLVVLKEVAEDPIPNDVYCVKCSDQYRVLKLTPLENDFEYSVEVWRRKENTENGGAPDPNPWEQVGQTIYPKMNGGKPFNRIPFVFFNPNDLSTEVEKPPLLDLVNINLSHYRTSADLEHGRHFTALPTAWVAGFDTAKNGQLYIGSSRAWGSSNPEAHAGFLVFTGAGLDALKVAMEHKEAQMAVLGARLLEQQKTAVEATQTLQLRESAQGTTLSGMVGTVSDGITKVLGWLAAWSGAEAEAVEFKLNQEFTILSIDAPTLTALFAALQSNRLSFEVWFYNLSRSNLMPPDRTLAQEKAAIETAGPMGVPASALLANANADATKNAGATPGRPVPGQQPPAKVA